MNDTFVTAVVFPALSAIILMVITTILAPLAKAWVEAKVGEIKSKTSNENYVMAKNIIRDLVLSARAHGLAGKIENAGHVLFDYVLTRAHDAFAAKGLDFDQNAVEDMIESAYMEFIKPLEDYIEDELDLSDEAEPQPAVG